jgi:copper chaperone NosL
MAISEKRYAAQFIDNEEQVFKFDDIGCMANFIKGQKNASNLASYFVMDFDDQEWIKADTAFYVRSSELETPMRGGIIAFKNQSKAQEAIAKYHGEMVSFKDIFNP